MLSASAADSCAVLVVSNIKNKDGSPTFHFTSESSRHVTGNLHLENRCCFKYPREGQELQKDTKIL